jgi:hypothetical protein
MGSVQKTKVNFSIANIGRQEIDLRLPDEMEIIKMPQASSRDSFRPTADVITKNVAVRSHREQKVKCAMPRHEAELDNGLRMENPGNPEQEQRLIPMHWPNLLLAGKNNVRKVQVGAIIAD